MQGHTLSSRQFHFAQLLFKRFEIKKSYPGRMKIRLLCLFIAVSLNLPAIDMETYKAKVAAAAEEQWKIQDEAWKKQVRDWPLHVPATEIEDLCTKVRLDQQAHWADIETVATDFEAHRKNKLENGLWRLWTPGIAVAMRLQQRTCTPEQADWLNRFIQCAHLAATQDADYKKLCVSLATRPPDPQPPGPEPVNPFPPTNAVNPNVAPSTAATSQPASPPTSGAPPGSVTNQPSATGVPQADQMALEQAVVSYTWTLSYTPAGK